MASGVTARFVLRSAAIRNAVRRAAPEAKAAGSPFSASSKSPLTGRIFRCPSEMSVCMGSMLPYHTATASSLMTSMLSVSRFSWLLGGWSDDH